MALLETLVITIGYAVAKGLFCYWLKDEPIIGTVGADLISLVRDRTKDVLAARRGVRFFDEIGDKVALRLEPVFRAYDEQPVLFGAKKVNTEAVAHEVALAIENARLSARLLTSLNNEPKRLYSHFLSSYPRGSKTLSETETALYERALDLCSQYVIDLASGLPEYTTSNFTEVLTRLDQSTEKLDKILEELDSLAEVSMAQKGHSADFERDYRAALVRKLDRINLFGARVARSYKRYKLSVAYVSLDIIEENDTSDDNEETEEARKGVEEALAKSAHCVIVGEAGSGKTTLLQWLAVNSAANTFSRAMLDWKDSVPFFIELRKFGSSFPRPEEYIGQLFPEIFGQMPKDWVQEQLRNGRALLLIDGLDEVKSNMRQKVYEAVENLLDSYPGIRVVLTSRPASLDFEPLVGSKFDVFRLAPMDFGEVTRFIEYWHQAVLIEPGLETADRAKAIREKLANDIKFSMPLSRLATNPLLLAMICALNYQGDMTLPSERIALYEACCTMLLEQRDIEKEVHQDEFPPLKYAQKRAFIDDLAYWMMKNGLTTVTVKQFKDRIGRKIPNMQFSTTDVDSERIKALLLERSGMLREPSRNAIDFVHRTFEEYMAASAAHAENDWGLLVRNSPDPLWRETIILAAGLANKTSADSLISEIIKKADNKDSDEATRSYLELLAISCLETAVEISSSVRAEVEARLRKILPPKNREQIASLVAAKDLAVKHLGQRPEYTDAESIACIQVLGRIATVPAIKQLGAYIASRRPKVMSVVEQALGQIASDDVSYSGLSNELLAYLGEITGKHGVALSGNLMLALSNEAAERIRSTIGTSVRDIWIRDSPSSCSLIPIWFPEATSIMLSGRSLPEDLYILSSLVKLEKLELKNLSPAWPRFRTAMFHHLKTLLLETNSEDWPQFNANDFPAIVTLHVRAKDITYWPDELENVTQFPRIKQLRIAVRDGELPDLSPLHKLRALESLQVAAKAAYLSDALYGIEELEDLRRLVIIVEDVTPQVTHVVRELRMGLQQCEIELSKNSRYYLC